MLKTSAIIMASGCSTRMHTNKLFLDYQGMTFLEHTLRVTEQADFFERILVISPNNLQNLTSTLPSDVIVVPNVVADTGQSASVRLGTKAASGEGYLYLTIDQPLLNQDIFEELFPVYRKERIVFPVDQKKTPYSPMFFGTVFRSELLQVTGKTGGRAVRNKHPEAWCEVQVKKPSCLLDIDTPEDYQKLIQSTSKQMQERKSR